MRGVKTACYLGALIGAGLIGTALPGSAQKKPKAESTIGYVDLAKVTEDIKKTVAWQESIKDFETQRAKFTEELKAAGKLRYLTVAEHAELDKLRAKPKPTDLETQRIKELEEKSNKLDQEYQTLAQVEKPNEVRLKELAKLREDGVTALQRATAEREEKLQKLEQQVLEDTQGRILKIVGQVAESKSLELILDKQAVLSGGTDITTDVSKKLEK